MANDALNKVQSALTKTVTAVNVKTSNFLEVAKIKTHINTVNSEISLLEAEIGREVYSLWSEDKFDISEIQEKCELMQQKYNSINELNAEISRLEEEERQILGDAGKNQNHAAPRQEFVAVCICAACGEKYGMQVKFCRKCGNKMVE